MQSEQFQTEFAIKLYIRSRKSELNYALPMFHQLTVQDWQTAFVETVKALEKK